MKCDKCSNYQPCPSGTEDGYYKACKENLHVGQLRLSKEEKQDVMDGKIKYCRGFEKI